MTNAPKKLLKDLKDALLLVIFGTTIGLIVAFFGVMIDSSDGLL